MSLEQALALILGSNLLSAWVTAKYAARKSNAEAAATAAGEWQKLYLQQKKENDEFRTKVNELEAELHKIEGDRDSLQRQLIVIEGENAGLQIRLVELEARLAKLESTNGS